jgi:ABC-type lipoprotein release transport system permease subunit
MNKEFKIFLFSLSLLLKRKTSYFIFLILTTLIFIIASASFVTESIKKELILTHDELPDIVIQKIVGGRQQYISSDYIEKIIDLPGIQSIYPRIWGYYYFDYASVNFALVGIDPLEPIYKKSLESAFKGLDINYLLQKDDWLIMGYGIGKLFDEIAYSKEAYFRLPNGEYLKLEPIKRLDKDSSIFTNDIVMVSKSTAQKILGLEDGFYTDIALTVYNKNETITLAAKIRDRLKDVRTVSKKDILNSYQNVFSYKSGFFITLFGILIFTMILIVVDKLSGLSQLEKTEIGVMKATGWTTSDVLKLKLYEAGFVSFQAYVVGIFLALVYVFILKAPLMLDIFSGYASLKINYSLIFATNFKVLFFVFISVVPFYVASVIIPSYKIATTDTYEVFR